MFESFTSFDVEVNRVRIAGVHSSKLGARLPPLLLLHGYPQSHLIWHKVAKTLAEHYTVVAPDLRGYGDSSKPVGRSDHSNYSKREMALDQLELMRSLGFESFFVCGHDRGGRVAHRMAVDHPAAVRKLMVLDISPTLAMYEQTSMAFAVGYWWWFFLVQPAPFPEDMIAASPAAYLARKIAYGRAGRSPFTDETYAAYLRYISDPATVHGMCEDYRAAATIDLQHDREDRASGRNVTCPVRVLWGQHGIVNQCFRPLDDWAAVATTVSGAALAAGHYIPEEAPEALQDELLTFFN